MKKFITLIALVACSIGFVSAQEYGVNFTRYAGHITTATTTHITTAASVLHTFVFNVTGSPSSCVVTLQTTETTPKIIYKSASLSAVTANPVVIALPVGISAASGLDLVTAGTTGTVDAWATYR